jgi:phenylalanyl-tRNA synthetase beta chain
LAGSVDEYPSSIDPVELELDPERTNRLLGTSLSTPSMIDHLSQLEFGVTSGKPIKVTVPTFRPDVIRQVDLVEEIGRLHGFEKIPVSRRAAGVLPTPRTASLEFENRVRDIVEGFGLSEAICNSLVDPEQVLNPDADPVRLRNPLSADLSAMRADLFGSALTVIGHNRNRRVDSVALYEIGTLFAMHDGEWPFSETRHLLIALCGGVPTAGWAEALRSFDYFDLKGTVVGLVSALGLTHSIEIVDQVPYQPGGGYAISSSDTRLGTMGQIDIRVAGRYGIKDRVWAAVLDLGAMMPASREACQYEQLPKYPAVYRDIAVVVSDQVLAGDLEASIRQVGGDLVESVRLFDKYGGDQIPTGKVGLAYAITYRSADRTLTDTDVNRTHDAVIEQLQQRYQAELRS